MPKVTVYNLSRTSVGELELSDDVFGAEVNEGLIYEVLKAQLASRRSGSANSKVRSEVAGSTRKIYRQKGTGRARHGSIRAPIFAGGGKAHGPKPRSYAYRPPRKMRAGALRSALSLRLREGRLVVIDELALEAIKTKKLAELLDKLEVGGGSLIIDASSNEKLWLSARNLAAHHVLAPEGVNLYDVLRYPFLVLTRHAATAVDERLRG